MLRLLPDLLLFLVAAYAMTIAHRAELDLIEAARQRSAVASACVYGEELRVQIGGKWQSFKCSAW